MKKSKKIYRYEVGEMTEDEKKLFVRKCEERFRRRLNYASKKVINSGKKIILLSGPSSSGKTTTSKKLIAYIQKYGAKVGVVSIDDFFRNKSVMEKEALTQGTAVDLDSVNAIDLAFLEKCVKDILSSKNTVLPHFDFRLSKRTGTQLFESAKYDYIIFEGIQAVYPEVTSLFGDKYISVQISVPYDITVNGEFFTSREVRFMRRMVRDCKFRNITPFDNFRLLKSVAENEDVNILPYDDTVDIHIDSFMPYGPCMIKEPLFKLLEVAEKTEKDAEFSEYIKNVRTKLSKVPSVSEKYLTDDSVYHEFLGFED